MSNSLPPYKLTSLSMGFSRPKILECVAISSSRGSSQPRDRTHISMSPTLAGRFFTTSATWEASLYTIYNIVISQVYSLFPCTRECKLHEVRDSVLNALFSNVSIIARRVPGHIELKGPCLPTCYLNHTM